jgi:hypothetical protein
VWAAAGFDGANAFGGQRVVADEEFAVFFGEDVVGDGGDVPLVAHFSAELKEESGFAAADGAANADSEGAAGKVARERGVALVKMARMIEGFVGVAVRAVIVRV